MRGAYVIGAVLVAAVVAGCGLQTGDTATSPESERTTQITASSPRQETASAKPGPVETLEAGETARFSGGTITVTEVFVATGEDYATIAGMGPQEIPVVVQAHVTNRRGENLESRLLFRDSEGERLESLDPGLFTAVKPEYDTLPEGGYPAGADVLGAAVAVAKSTDRITAVFQPAESSRALARFDLGPVSDMPRRSLPQVEPATPPAPQQSPPPATPPPEEAPPPPVNPGYDGVCDPIPGPAQDPDCLNPGAATDNPLQEAYNECVASGEDPEICGQI